MSSEAPAIETVALSLALAKRPRVLLLDEPLAAPDPLARREFLTSLADVTVEGDVTVVLSSHLVHDLERVCANVAGGQQAALSCLAAHGYHQHMTYLPTSRFWPVQGVESGIFAILALALAIFTYWWVTTREA